MATSKPITMDLFMAHLVDENGDKSTLVSLDAQSLLEEVGKRMYDNKNMTYKTEVVEVHAGRC